MRLTTTGMKARDQEVELGKLNLITAPNGSGKSTLADAVRFLALGYVPALGRRPMDTAVLMRARDLAVRLHLDDGRVIHREITATKTGSYQVGAECSWLGKAKPTEHAAEALRLFCKEEIDVAEALDIRQLLSATPNQRSARIAALLEAGRASAEERAGEVASLTVQRLAGLADGRMPEDYRKALDLVAERPREVLRDVGEMLLAKIGAGIETALTWANDSKNAAARDLAGKGKAKAEIEARVAQLPPAPPGEMERLEAERSRYEREMGATRERQAEARRKADAIAQAQAELADRKARIRKAATEIERVHRLLPDPDAARAEIEEVRKQLDTLAPPAPPAESAEAATIRNEIAKIEHILAELCDPEIPDESEAQREFERLSRALGEAKKSPWYEVARIAVEVEKAAGKTKALREAAHRLKALAVKHGPKEDAEAVAEKLTQAERELERVHATVEHARETAAAVKAEREKFIGRRAQLARRLMEVNAGASRAGAEAQAAFDRARNDLIIRRDELEDRLDALHAAEEAMTHAQAAHDHAVKRVAELGPAEAVPQGESATLQAALTNVTAKIAAIQGAAATRTELTRIVSEIEHLEASREVMAAIEWSLQRAREREITDAGGPLVGRMGEFLAAAGRHESPYFRAGAGKCEIGWRTVEGREVAVSALSGGEFCLFAAALTAAVIVLRASPLRVLLIEAGETDDTTMAGLLAGIEAVSADLSCAIVLTPRPAEAGEDWTVHRLEAPAGVGVAA